MKKVLYFLGVAVIAIFLVSGIQKIFADITNTVSGDKEERFVSVENSPLSIVGLVTEILGDNSIKVYARDNKIYTVDLSNSEIVFGDLGYYGELSSFDKIKITDQVTVVFDNEPYDSKIIAKEIAHRRTPEAIIKRQKDLAELFNVKFATSTDNLLNKENELVDEQNVETATTTSTTTSTTTLASDQNSTTSLEVNSGETSSIIDTVAGVAKDVIQNTADTLINVIDTVTGGETDTPTQPDSTINQNTIEQPIEENSVNTEVNASVDNVSEQTTTE